MIYLYAGLGMAMMLPILVGLQSAIFVAELEQGELAMQDSGGKVEDDWKKRQKEKKDFMISVLDLATDSCPEGLATRGFDKISSEECTFSEVAPKSDVSKDYNVRLYFNNNSGKYACLLPRYKDLPADFKCPKEV